MTYTDLLTNLDPGTGETLTETRVGALKYDMPVMLFGNDAGAGEDLYMHAIVKTAAAAAASTTTIEVQVIATHLPVATATVTSGVTIAITTGIVTHTAHGFPTGMPVVITGGGGATEIVRGTTYYVIKIDANTYYLALNLANALAGTEITTAAASTGTLVATSVPQGHTALMTAATTDIITVTGHGLSTGTPVIIDLGKTPATLTGVSSDIVYYVIRIDANTFKIATTPANAVAGPAVDITAVTDTNGVLTLYAPPTVIATSGAIYKDMLTVGTLIAVPFSPRIDMGIGNSQGLARTAGRHLWARFVPSVAATAGRFQVDVVKNYHGGRGGNYPTGLVVA